MSNPLKKIEHVGKQFVGEIEDAGKRSIGKVEDAASGGVSRIVGQATAEIGHIEDAGKAAARELEKTAELIASAPFRFAAREAIALAVSIIEIKPPDSYDMRIGPVRLEIHDIRERIDTLKMWRDHPPKHVADIRTVIETLAPTRVHLATQLSLPVSDALSVGIRMDWTTAEFLEFYDRIMALIKR